MLVHASESIGELRRERALADASFARENKNLVLDSLRSQGDMIMGGSQPRYSLAKETSPSPESKCNVWQGIVSTPPHTVTGQKGRALHLEPLPDLPDSRIRLGRPSRGAGSLIRATCTCRHLSSILRLYPWAFLGNLVAAGHPYQSASLFSLSLPPPSLFLGLSSSLRCSLGSYTPTPLIKEIPYYY